MVQQRVDLERERPKYRQTSSEVSGESLADLRSFKVAQVALGQNGTGNTYVFTWQNPEDNIIIVTEVIIYIITASGAGSNMNVAVVTGAAANGDTIFDALDLNTTGAWSSQILADTGTNGTEVPRIVAENGGGLDWITGYEAAGASYSALVGYAFIFYTEL